MSNHVYFLNITFLKCEYESLGIKCDGIVVRELMYVFMQIGCEKP